MMEQRQPYGSLEEELEELGLHRPPSSDSQDSMEKPFVPSSSSKNNTKNKMTLCGGNSNRPHGVYVVIAISLALLGGAMLYIASKGFSLGTLTGFNDASNFALTLQYKTTADIGYKVAMESSPTASPTYSICEIQVVQRIDFVTYAQAGTDETFKAAFIRGVISGGKIRQSEMEYIGVTDTLYGDAVDVTYNVRKTSIQLPELETLVRNTDVNSAIKSYLIAAGFKDADTLTTPKIANFSPTQAPTMHPTVAYAAIQVTQRIDGITLTDVNGNVKFLSAIATGIAQATMGEKEDVAFVGIEDCADGLGINVEYTLRKHNTSAIQMISSVQSVSAQIAVTSALNDYGFTTAQLQETAIVMDLSPTMKPSIMPSMKPTLEPTREPTALNTPSAAPSQKLLTATIVQTIEGVTVQDTISDSFVTTIQSTVAKTLNVPTTSVVFNGVYPTSSKTGVNVEYTVQVSWTNRAYIHETLSKEDNIAELTSALQSAGFTLANVAMPDTTDVSPTYAPSFRAGSPTPAPTEYVKCDEYSVVEFLQRFDGVNAAQANTEDFKNQVIQGVAAGTGLLSDNVVVLSVKASKFGEAVDYNYIVMAPDTNADALTELVKGAAVTDMVLENLRTKAGYPSVSVAADAIPSNLCKSR